MTVLAEVVELPLERLEAEICELAGHLAAGECQMLLRVAEFDRREGWTGWGIQSCAHWLAWRCGLGIGAAREKVRVARRLEEMPLVREAFSTGELSYSKVRALARAVEPSTEVRLLEMARTATTQQLEVIVRAYRRTTGDEERSEHDERRQRRSVTWFWDDDGSLVIQARLSPEDGAVVLAALEAEEKVLRQALHDAAETLRQEPQVTRADALTAVARAALSVSADPDALLPGIVVHVDAAALSGDDGPGRCHLENGPSIPPETARRLACDAITITMVTSDDANPLDIGRKSRVVPTSMRRAVKRRDGGCRFPGCTNTRYVEAHHVIFWRNGGPTALTNLILLCSKHHHAVHEGGYGVTSPSPHHFVFTDPFGRTIPDVPPPLELTGPTIQARNHAAGLDITPTTCRSLGEGERFDLADAVEALLTEAALGA